jgi:hypothetical protein
VHRRLPDHVPRKVLLLLSRSFRHHALQSRNGRPAHWA